VRRGEVVVIIGPSGSGKTTFVRCLNHLEKIESGRIFVNGHLIGYRERGGRLVEDRERNIARQRREIGMVFQRFNLFHHKTALGNIVEAPIHVLGVPEREAVAIGRDLLARVGLSDKADVYPAQLSGGQQQRVAIARALVNRPAILLADEPTGNLDSRTSVEIMGVFQDLNDKGLTIVLVTHEQDIAHFAKRVLVFRDGTIRSDQPVANRPRAREVLKTLPALDD